MYPPWMCAAGGMGTPGMVLAAQSDTVPGTVRVIWDNDMVFEHPLGRDGVVTVCCLRAECGGAYYRDHLAELDTRLLQHRRHPGGGFLFFVKTKLTPLPNPPHSDLSEN